MEELIHHRVLFHKRARFILVGLFRMRDTQFLSYFPNLLVQMVEIGELGRYRVFHSNPFQTPFGMKFHLQKVTLLLLFYKVL